MRGRPRSKIGRFSQIGREAAPAARGANRQKLATSAAGADRQKLPTWREPTPPHWFSDHSVLTRTGSGTGDRGAPVAEAPAGAAPAVTHTHRLVNRDARCSTTNTEMLYRYRPLRTAHCALAPRSWLGYMCHTGGRSSTDGRRTPALIPRFIAVRRAFTRATRRARPLPRPAASRRPGRAAREARGRTVGSRRRLRRSRPSAPRPPRRRRRRRR